MLEEDIIKKCIIFAEYKIVSTDIYATSNNYPKQPRSNHQYKCELCNVTLNSEVQLLQHLRSQRHKATLEGKPPKPRWVPYERFREQQRLQAKLVSKIYERVTVKTIYTHHYIIFRPNNTFIISENRLKIFFNRFFLVIGFHCSLLTCYNTIIYQNIN